MIHCHCCGDVCSGCGRCRICGQYVGRWHRPYAWPRPHGPYWADTSVTSAVGLAREAMRR